MSAEQARRIYDDGLVNNTGNQPDSVQSLQYGLRGDFQHLQSANIMMVDDELITMRILQSFLEEAGYCKFHLVSDSDKAMDELCKQKPDVLLLDVNMPGTSGFDILALLRKEPEFSHLPVIILTSSSDAQTKLQALDLGATDFLSKPVDPSELALRVRNTLAAKAYQDQLTYYDALTNLPNAQLFQERTLWATMRAERDSTKLVVMHIVFGDFKRVADTFGPSIGDEVLKQLADRLSGKIRLSDAVSRDTNDNSAWNDVFRIGGAEFSILLPVAESISTITAIGARIMDVMSDPLDADGTDVYLAPSIGVAAYPDDARDASLLIKHAMAASSQAVAHAGQSIKFYSSSMNERSLGRMRMEANLRRGIASDAFKLLYQPKVCVKTGQIVGAEALIRWLDEDGRIVSPNEFIPVAEDTGLILPIGEWVLREACRQIVDWRSQDVKLKMSVNVSARQFFESDLVKLVSSVISEYALEPELLVLEMTESILVDEVDTALQILAQLRTLGVKISIDDFGTGYSSLSYLKTFRADEVKIDRAFIMDLTSSREDQALVYAIAYLAHEMGFTVCAEGVEYKAQRDYLLNVQCDEYQGYYFSRPVTASDFISLYRQSA